MAAKYSSDVWIGLLAFHVFCDKHEIQDSLRAPCSPDLLAAFVASLAGIYSGKTLRNYVAGVKAWHILHRIPWQIQDEELSRLLTGAERRTPLTAIRPPREPFTTEHIAAIGRNLNFNASLDVAVYACLTTAFIPVCDSVNSRYNPNTLLIQYLTLRLKICVAKVIETAISLPLFSYRAQRLAQQERMSLLLLKQAKPIPFKLSNVT